jgi:hypothetical protein
MHDIADGLLTTAEAIANFWGDTGLGRGEQDLGAAKSKGIGRAKALFEG